MKCSDYILLKRDVIEGIIPQLQVTSKSFLDNCFGNRESILYREHLKIENAIQEITEGLKMKKYTVFYNKFVRCTTGAVIRSTSGAVIGFPNFIRAELGDKESKEEMLERLGIKNEELLWIFEGHPKQEGEKDEPISQD